MRYTENKRYYTAESTITWPLDPLIHQTPPLSLSLPSYGTRPLITQTIPRLPKTLHSDYPRTCCKEHYALFRFLWTQLKQIRRRRPFPSPAPQQLPISMLPSLMRCPPAPRLLPAPVGTTQYNDSSVYKSVSVTHSHAFSGCGRAQPTGDDHDSPRAAPLPGKGGARAGYDDGGAPGRFMGHATRVLAFEATTAAIHVPHFTHTCPPSITA